MKHITYLISAATLSVALTAACNPSAKTHHDDDEKEHAEEKEHASDDIHLTEQQAKDAQLKVETIQPTQFAEVFVVTGRVLPAAGSEATVSATMDGIVSFTNPSLTEGSTVGAGAALFTINAKSVANGNPAGVAKAELDAARTALERAKQLAEERLITQSELNEAQMRYNTAAAASESLGSAEQQRSVSSSIGGFIKSVNVRQGDYVATGQVLATVTQSKHLQLRADVPERFYSKISGISSANFRMSYDASRTYRLSDLNGRLVSKGQATADGDIFVPVIFEFNNQGDIVPGSYAEIYLLGKERAAVIAVPNEAITEAQGLHFVYVQTSDGDFNRREVRLGATDGKRTEILAGLKAGEKVVIHGAMQVRLAASSGAVPEGHSHNH